MHDFYMHIILIDHLTADFVEKGAVYFDPI